MFWCDENLVWCDVFTCFFLMRSEQPDKLHRTIKTCLMASSGAARDAMLAALELDLGVRITAIAGSL
jgi:hypothetical protein